MIFDTHAHYDDEAFDCDREELLLSMQQNGVEKIVNIGASMETSKNTLELVAKYPFFYGALGVHPSETADLTEADIQWLKEHSKEERIVAIGEIGLDYHWPDPSPEVQKKWFIRQIQLAREVVLPMVIHSRDAAKDTLDIMRAEKASEIGGVIHCYSYSKEQARDYLDMDFFFGIGGVVTFKNARKLVETVEYVPMDHIVIETDCPYLSPEPNRGRRNSSINLTYVAQKIAEIKGIDSEEVIQITMENAKRLYRL